MSIPFSRGALWMGIPSSRTHLRSPCVITSPAAEKLPLGNRKWRGHEGSASCPSCQISDAHRENYFLTLRPARDQSSVLTGSGGVEGVGAAPPPAYLSRPLLTWTVDLMCHSEGASSQDHSLASPFSSLPAIPSAPPGRCPGAHMYSPSWERGPWYVTGASRLSAHAPENPFGPSGSPLQSSRGCAEGQIYAHLQG